MPVHGTCHRLMGYSLHRGIIPLQSTRGVLRRRHFSKSEGHPVQLAHSKPVHNFSLQPGLPTRRVQAFISQPSQRTRLGCSTATLADVVCISDSDYVPTDRQCTDMEQAAASTADSQQQQAWESECAGHQYNLHDSRPCSSSSFDAIEEQRSTSSAPSASELIDCLSSNLTASKSTPALQNDTPLSTTSEEDFISSTSLVPSLTSARYDPGTPTTTTTVITTTITTTKAPGSSNRSITTTSISIQREDGASKLDDASSTASIKLPSTSSGNFADNIPSCTSSGNLADIPSYTSSAGPAVSASLHNASLPSGLAVPAQLNAAPNSDPTVGAASLLVAEQALPSQERPADATNPMSLWALFMLFISYVHHSASGCAVPAMLPVISPDLHLSDLQGAFLTSGYFYLYAIALIPVGLAADKTSRPLLLSAGLTLWSALTMKMGQVHDFNELLMARVGFAAAQATQNPISFALIPEMFPKNKTTALAVYNCAMHLGRALAFAAVILARSHPDAPVLADQVTAQMLPLDQLDLRTTSLLYVQGHMAAVLPIYDYNYQIIEYGPVQEAAWRHLLWCFGPPGILIAGLLAFTVREPRSKQKPSMGAEILIDSDMDSDCESGPILDSVQKREEGPSKGNWQPSGLLSGLGLQASVPALALATEAAAASPSDLGIVSQTPASLGQFRAPQFPGLKLPSFDAGPLTQVLKIPAFQAVTFAAAMNDVGSYALIAWHSTFYERVFHLDSSIYAPLLAIVTPIGGIVGGVGGGFLADYLDKKGGRAWMTVGASLVGAPLMAASLLAPTYQLSFAALLCGFAMSEAWRSPAAIMISSIAPSSQASTAQSLYICIRNLVGGIGPLAVAEMAEQVGLQKAMLLAPVCYLCSGLIFMVAEQLLAKDAEQNSSIPKLNGPTN